AVLRCDKTAPYPAQRRKAIRRRGPVAAAANEKSKPCVRTSVASVADIGEGQALTFAASLLPRRAGKGIPPLPTENFTIQSRPNQRKTSRASGGASRSRG